MYFFINFRSNFPMISRLLKLIQLIYNRCQGRLFIQAYITLLFEYSFCHHRNLHPKQLYFQNILMAISKFYGLTRIRSINFQMTTFFEFLAIEQGHILMIPKFAIQNPLFLFSYLESFFIIKFYAKYHLRPNYLRTSHRYKTIKRNYFWIKKYIEF